jgi:hypothetical protein
MASRRRLDGLTLIDTPGLLSLNREYSAGTERALRPTLDPDSCAAVGQADALIYLMPHPDDSDRTFLESIDGVYSDDALSAASVIGVISKVDRLTARPGLEDPWPNARKVAGNYARKLRRALSAVVPVAGLLAETASSDTFTEREAIDLARLADLAPERRSVALASVDAFRADEEIALPLERREVLLRYLDLYGLRAALDLIDSGRRSAGALLEGLRDLSGVAALEAALTASFAGRAGVLRTARALRDLDRLTYGAPNAAPQALDRLRDGIEELRLDPDMHVLDEVALLRAMSSGRISISPERERAALLVLAGDGTAARVGLATGADDAAIAAAAREQATHWRRLVNDPGASTAEARVGRVLATSLDRLWLGESP